MDKNVPDTPLPSEGSGKRVNFAAFSTNKNPNISGKSPLDTCSIKSSLPSSQSQRGGEKKSPVILIEHLSEVENAGLGIGEKCNIWLYGKIHFLSRKWFTHCFLFIVMILYTVGGAVIFLTVEGQNETKLIEKDIELQTKELLNELRQKSLKNPTRFSEKEWSAEAARRLFKFEGIITKAFKQHPLVVSHTSGRVWTIWNSIFYCSTLYTTIGYGHLYPTTFTGRVLTIAYSTIGIPLFLIVLTDFGKLFTRGIKFVWSYIRRFYYTRNCRRVRKTSHVQEIMKGAQVMYEYATFRRPSMRAPTLMTELKESSSPSSASVPQSGIIITEPQTPAISNFEIDDEFNLPISLALTILVVYMLVGTSAYMVWENWDFFPAFYFVFISMSTVGFGDIVPEQPVYMIVSILYLCFGLALMTMCINVVQDKLSDTVNQAQTKIGETIGVVTEDEEEIDEKVNDEEQEEINKNVKENDDDDDEEAKLIEEDDTSSPFKWSTAKVVN